MKKTLLFSVILFLTCLSSIAQWELQNPKPTGNSFKSVYFTDASKGYIVGDSGTIFKTTDGGVNWVTRVSGTIKNLNFVVFTSANTGYAFGDEGTILKTNNGGETWITQTSGLTIESIVSASFISADTGYAFGANFHYAPSSAFLTTVNGGATWTKVSTGPGHTVLGICFTNAKTGISVGTSCGTDWCTARISKTTNGGATWTDIPAVLAFSLSSVCFTGANTGFAVGYYNNRITYGGRILKTTDAGATWDTISCGTPYNLISVFFADQNTGYAVGISGTILKTTDAGATWTAQSSGTTNILHAVYFTSANTGWAVGDSGTILKTTNGGYGLGLDDHQPAISSANNLKIYPNPATEKITVEPSEAGMNLKGVVNIYRVTGQPLIRQQVQSSVAEINVGSLPAGIYFLTLVNNEKVAVGKFIKN